MKTKNNYLKAKRTGLELAEEDIAKGRVTQWNSVDEMFDTILGNAYAKKTGIEEATDDIRQGRLTEYESAEDMFEKLGV